MAPCIRLRRRSHQFCFLKTPPAADLLKKAAGVDKGAATPNKTKIGSVTHKQVEEIAQLKLPDLNCSTLESARINTEAMKSGALPKVTWEKIVEHIDHAVKVAGVDHVGLGSDFDGATMPIGMEDASKLPQLTDALLTAAV